MIIGNINVVQVLSLMSAFSDFFPSAGSQVNITNIQGNKPYSKEYFIDGVLFENFNMQTALIFSSFNRPVFLVIERSAFSYCQTGADDGGALYYHSNDGGMALQSVCAFHCYTEAGKGQFCWAKVGFDEKISMNIVAIQECAPATVFGTRYSPISFTNGNISLKNFNSSKNQVFQYSCLSVENMRSFNITFCSFIWNTATNYYGIYLYDSDYTAVNMSYGNFISNREIGLGYGLLYAYKILLYISYSYFKDNDYILFYGGLSNLTLNDCYIQHYSLANIFYAQMTLIKITNNYNTTTSKFTETIPVEHFSTHQCAEAFYHQNIPCETIPPLPTECFVETSTGISSISLIKIVNSLLALFVSFE